MRVLCAAVLVLSIGAAPLPAQQSLPDFDALARETTQRLSEYLQVRTVNPPGNEVAGARYLQRLLANEGITAEVFESAPGRGNLYARLPGTGRKRPLILLSHLDVVPADSARWQVAPFSGAIRDGYVWGRGALDMKGEGMVEVMTLIALKRRGIPLSRDIILIGNADEETRSSGAAWFAREKAALIRDAEYLINEGGDNQVGPDGKVLYYGIEVTEKVPFWIRLTTRGTPGHGSRPTPDNPVARLSRAVGRIAAWETPLILTPPVAQFFQDLASREPDPRHRAWLRDPASALKDPEARAWFTSDLYTNAILRNTVSITGLQGSGKTNVIPAEATAELDIRLLPGQSPDSFEADLRRIIGDSLVEITRLSPSRTASTAPLAGELVGAIRATVEQMDPGALVTTPMLTGYTDSYYYRELGIGAYGLDPFRTSDADSRGIHGNDERVSLANIRFGVEFFFRIVEKTAR